MFCLYGYICTTHIHSYSTGIPVEYPGTVVMDACEPSCKCWGELNLRPLNDQQELLTTKTSL